MQTLSLLSFDKIYISESRYKSLIDIQVFFPEIFEMQFHTFFGLPAEESFLKVKLEDEKPSDQTTDQH